MTRRNLVLALQAVVTIVLMTVLSRGIDWARFSAVLQQLSPAFYFSSLLLVALGQVLYAWRWWVVLTGMGVSAPFGEVLRQDMIAHFFSNLLPTAVGGDAAKVYYLGKRSGFVVTAASVFVDRFLGFAWLSFIACALAWTVSGTTEIEVLNRNLLTLLSAGFLAALLVAKVVPIDGAIERLVPLRWRGAAEKVGAFVRMASAGALRPVTFVTVGAIVGSYMWVLALIYQHHFAANGFGAVPVWPVMMTIISVSILSNVPISLNGIGLREQLHVLMFTALGIPAELSVSISLLLFTHTLLLSVVGWVLWLRLRPALQPSTV